MVLHLMAVDDRTQASLMIGIGAGQANGRGALKCPAVASASAGLEETYRPPNLGNPSALVPVAAGLRPPKPILLELAAPAPHFSRTVPDRPERPTPARGADALSGWLTEAECCALWRAGTIIYP